MSLLLEADDMYVLMRLRALLKAAESPLSAGFEDLCERLYTLRHCHQCGNFGEFPGDTCAPCLDLEAIGEANEARAFRGHQ